MDPRHTRNAIVLVGLLLVFVLFIKQQQMLGGGSQVIGKNTNSKGLKASPPTSEVNFYNDKYYPASSSLCRRSFEKPGTLPGFIVAGGHKCGSTTLFTFLALHGKVRPSSCKEVHFFDDYRGREWYGGDYMGKKYANAVEDVYRHWFYPIPEESGAVTGEGTPSYIRNPIVPSRIAKSLPDARILFALRDPTTRFISHWMGQVAKSKWKKKKPPSCNGFFEAGKAQIEDCMSMCKNG